MFVATDSRLFIGGGTEVPVITFNNNPTNAPNLQLFFAGTTLNLPKNNASFGNSPPQYWLFGLPSCANLKWTGGSFIGVIYAPTMSLNAQGNADLQGAIVAYSFSCQGTFNFHYDDSTGASTSKPFKIRSWAEL